MRGLSGRRIIVASGATGIGAATAIRLAAEGARLVVGDINDAALERTVAGIKATGGAARAVHYDLADAASIRELVASCERSYGGIDGLVAVGADVGTATLPRDVEVTGMEVPIWERTLQVNLIGHALLMQAALPGMSKQQDGAIVSVSSAAAYYGDATMPAYSASKAGLQALVRHVARRWGKDNVRCNAVAPGLVLTGPALATLSQDELDEARRHLPLPRLGEPEDIAGTIAFLQSADAAWITGQVFAVNGGRMFRE